MQKHPNKVFNKAIKDEIVAKQLLVDHHRKKTAEVDILRKKSDLLRARFDELRESYELVMMEFWPCPKYAEMGRMIRKCVTIEEPERGNSGRVSRGPIIEVKERLQRQSVIAREIVARENAYLEMRKQELRIEIAHLDKALTELRNRILAEEDRLDQLTIEYEKSLTLSPLYRYFRLRTMIEDAIGYK